MCVEPAAICLAGDALLRHNLIHRSIAPGASLQRGSIEIAGGVDDQGAHRPLCVPSAAEVMEYGFRPSSIFLRRQLERDATTVRPANLSRPIKIAGVIKNQASVGFLPVAAVPEAVQQLLPPGPARLRHQLEHSALPIDSAFDSGAVQISRGVKN